MQEARQGWERDRQEWCARLQHAENTAEKRLREYQERKVVEMGQIHGKLQDVLDKKNDTIGQLREALGAAKAQLAAHEQDMRKHKLELFEQMKW